MDGQTEKQQMDMKNKCAWRELIFSLYKHRLIIRIIYVYDNMNYDFLK